MKLVALVCLAFIVGTVYASCGANSDCEHGSCRNNVCECSTGYGGDDCSLWDHEISSGEVVSGHVETFYWKYFHMNLPNGANGLIITVTQTSEFGDIDLFVGKNFYPTLDNFNYQDTSTGSLLTIRVVPASAGTWYVGLYGYWSADFEITVEAQFACTVDCGENGFCDGDVCACYDPYFGEDCSTYDQAIQSGQTVFNSVETGEWKYFNIDISQGQSIHVEVEQDTTAYDIDVFIGFNRYPTLRIFDFLNETTSQITEISVTDLDAGHYEIGIYGYRGGAFSLVVHVSEPLATCDNDCSGLSHGSCVQNTCSCLNGYDGDYCETYEPAIELNQDYTGSVASGKWNYWRVHYFTESSLKINVDQTTFGDCDLYVKQNSDPTRVVYQFSDLSLDDSFSVTIENPGDETWHVGIYGWTGCEYSLNAEILDDCQCTENSHGSCHQGSTQCFCEVNFAGTLCDIPTLGISSGQVLSLQFIQPHSWNYYHFTSDASGVIITMVETSTSGDLFLAASLSGYPSGENFEYYDTSESSFHELHIIWRTQPVSRTYFIGVLTSTASVATEPIEYSITAYGTPF